MRKEDIVGKILNACITGEKFVNKDLNDYIYASLSQPPIKIINKNGSKDELNYTVECPNCGNHVNYGEQIFMMGGYIYCNVDDCRNKLLEKNEYLKRKYDE